MKAKQFFPLTFVLLIATTACTNTVKDIEINEKNFPDENFRAWVLEQEYGKDSILTAEEIAGIDTIEVFGDRDDIKNLKGIEYFTALTYLNCLNWPLIELDVSKNTKLKDLLCGSFLIGNRQLTVLDISKNKALTKLYCGENKLTELNLSECTLLTEVYCNNNQLTSLDLSRCTSLTKLWCDNNQLTSLDISRCTSLTNLWCDNNQLTSLDLSRCTSLTYLSCDNNQLTSLDLSRCTSLTNLRCDNNQLTSLDLSRCTSLTNLRCDNNQLTSLDLSRCTSLTELYCYQNQIRDAAMDALVESLPTVNNGVMKVKWKFEDGNEMTTRQVYAAKAKGWTPYFGESLKNGSEVWYGYDGIDEEGVYHLNLNVVTE